MTLPNYCTPEDVYEELGRSFDLTTWRYSVTKSVTDASVKVYQEVGDIESVTTITEIMTELRTNATIYYASAMFLRKLNMTTIQSKTALAVPIMQTIKDYEKAGEEATRLLKNELAGTREIIDEETASSRGGGGKQDYYIPEISESSIASDNPIDNDWTS